MMTLQSSSESSYISKTSPNASNAQSCTSKHFPSYGNGAALAFCMYTFTAGDTNSYNFVILAASTDDIPTTNLTFTAAYTGEGTLGTGSHSGSYALTIQNQYSLTATNSTASSPRAFTKIYNQYFFGNDDEKSNAFVFEELQRIYGSQYKSFIYYTTGGTTRGFFSAYGRTGVSTTYYPQSTADNSIDMHCIINTDMSGANIDSGWNFTLPTITPDPNLSTNTAGKVAAAAIFGEYTPDELDFDVYVDGVIGQTAPQFVVKFRNAHSDSSISPAMVTPRIWGWPVPQPESPAIVSEPPVITVDGIKVPNETDANHGRTQYAESFEFSGSLSSPYVSFANGMTSWRPIADQVAFFGTDRIADSVRLYLRFDYIGEGIEWGDLWYVDIPFNYEGAAYIEPHKVDDSKKNAPFSTRVNIIGGLPPTDPEPDDDEPEGGEDPEGTPSGDGPYAPDGYEDLSDGEPTGFDGDAVLTTTYSMPKLTMQSVGADLWSNTYFNVLKIQTNPIENIIACKWYPMSLSGTPNTPIKIGDVTLGVSADKIGTMYTKSFGTYTHTTKSTRPGYLSMTPYCIVKLHLPYVGVVQLDATEIYKRALTGKYIVDLITGDVLVMLYLDGNPYMSLTGKMGVDIPLTSTNRVQTELAAASRTLSAVIGGAGHLMAGDSLGAAGAAASGIMSIMGMDYSSQRCTSHSPACCTYENLWIFIEVQYNPSKVSAGYKTQRGFPAHLYQTLSYMASQGGGFIQLDGRTVINVAMTEEENRMLEQIMTSGFYL